MAAGLFDQPRSLAYPTERNFKRTETSASAAAEVAGRAATLRRKALEAIQAAGEHGLTADECAEALGEESRSSAPRLSELRALGLIRDSGARRPSRFGKGAIVWRAA